jgi:hypothetical protein
VFAGAGHDDVTVGGGTSVFAGDGWDVVELDLTDGPARDVTVDGGAGDDYLIIDCGDGPAAAAMAKGLPIFNLMELDADLNRSFSGTIRNPHDGSLMEIDGFEHIWVRFDDSTILY